MAITDEQLQAIERKCERQDDGQFVFGYDEAMADMATLRQALRERATYSEDTHGRVLAAEINALPDRLRAYVADLEQRADPAHDLRRAHLAEQTAAALERQVQEMRLALQDSADWIEAFAAGASRPPKDGREVLAAARAALATLQRDQPLVLADGHTTLRDALSESNEALELAAECAEACDDQNAAHLSSCGSIIQMLVHHIDPSAAPNPKKAERAHRQLAQRDSKRLDKLERGSLFHSIRHPRDGSWHLTYDTSSTYDNLRAVIDAHQELGAKP